MKIPFIYSQDDGHGRHLNKRACAHCLGTAPSEGCGRRAPGSLDSSAAKTEQGSVDTCETCVTSFPAAVQLPGGT